MTFPIIVGICVLFLIIVVGLGIFAFIGGIKSEHDLADAIGRLGLNRTDAGAIEFMNFVAKVPIVNQPQFYNQLRAAWGIVRDSRTISKPVKDQVKLVMQMRGVILR